MKRNAARQFGSVTFPAVLAVAVLVAGVQAAWADPHVGQSLDVVIIGGTTLDWSVPCSGSATDANTMSFTWGGCLPLTGPAGELGDFNFTAMDPAAVSAASLAPFDTAVLNMATNAMACNTNTLSPAQQADLVAFVADGKKLLIYDSECYPGPVDYSWLPFPFTTANPGALGAPGTLTIVEENTLSSNDTLDPHYIDAAYLGANTDAVGDMNVMTTFDPNWCIDMSGTNAIGVSGPVHTYAKYPAGTDVGLFIYNGLDMDYLYNDDAELRKVWVYELQQPFDPSNLPCGVTVVGIALAPPTSTNPVGTVHTVTATLADILGNPQPGVEVTFTVLIGPNAGAAGTCSPNADCTSDANGAVSFRYLGSGGVGIDQIEACFLNDQGAEVCSQVVSKEWIILGPPPRVDATKKGSLLVFPKVELKWNAAGVPIQDTFVSIINDYPDDVFIHWYFINGDEPLEAIVAGDPPVLVERAHPGWNCVNCTTVLTQNEPVYFSALTGSGTCQPFTTLDSTGGIVGRLDPESADGSRVLRGFAVVYAVDRFGNEISWNHLSGTATLVNYLYQAAWEYNAYAFQASAEFGMWTDDTPGVLQLDGLEYDICFDKLLLDFYTVGSPAFSRGSTAVMLDTDLTLLPVMADLRQDSDGPVITKAKFDIWNENEDGFSGTTRCITCWDQTLLSNYELPNHFMMSTIHTDKGKARIDGVRSDLCDYGPCEDGNDNLPDRSFVPGWCSQDAPLLGVSAKILGFSGAASGRAYAGSTLVGQGEEAGYIFADIVVPPDTLTDPAEVPVVLPIAKTRVQTTQ